MKRFSSLLKGKTVRSGASNDGGDAATAPPEKRIVQAIKSFCSQPPAQAGDEVVHLPAIVDAAESSPTAATAGARQIRDFLAVPSYHRGHPNAPQAHVQYNAIMLIRILSDNPGPNFTRNFDSKFVSAVKNVLRNHWDPSVQTLMRETLASFDGPKSDSDPNLKSLMALWQKERDSQEASFYSHQMVAQTMAMSRMQVAPPAMPPNRPPTQLPQPEELQARVEEARTSAQLLIQLCGNTSPEDLRNNDLVKEFADRCTSAQRSMQAYMSLDPSPEVFQTLIETSEQLNVAQSRYNRAMLASQRTHSTGSAPTLATRAQSSSPPILATRTPSSLPAVANGINGSSAPSLPPVSTSSTAATQQADANPFSDANQVGETVLRARNPYAAPKAQAQAQSPQPSGYATELAGLKLDAPDYPLTATGFPPAGEAGGSSAPALHFTNSTGLPAAETAQRAEKQVQQGHFAPPAGPPPAKAKVPAQHDDDDDLYGSGSPVVGRVRDV